MSPRFNVIGTAMAGLRNKCNGENAGGKFLIMMNFEEVNKYWEDRAFK